MASNSTSEKSFYKLLVFYFIYFLNTIDTVIIYSTVDLLTKSDAINSYPNFIKQHVPFFTGVMLSFFPLAQLCVAPLIGSLSDKYGRKFFFVTCLLLSAFSAILSSYTLFKQYLIFFAFSRFTAGSASALLSLCQASVADLVNNEDRRRRLMSFFSIPKALGWLFTPLALGFFIHNHQSINIELAIPFLLLGFLLLATALYISIFFKNSNTLNPNTIDQYSITSFFFKSNHSSILYKLVVIFGFWIFGWMLFRTYLPAYFYNHQELSAKTTGLLFSFYNLSSLIGGIIGSSSFFNTERVNKGVILSMLICIIGMFFYSFFDNNLSIWLSGGLVCVFHIIVMSYLINLCSVYAPENQKGKILGITNALQAFAAMVSVIFSRQASILNSQIPLFASACCFLFSWIIYRLWIQSELALRDKQK
ncbi:MAG: MFS transporter [Rhabdochlamydiaceae bacterium]